jgi:phage baseplate assembly protein W
MEIEDTSSLEGINQEFDVLATPSRMAIESELSEALRKLEHRIEILTCIYREQQISGQHAMAEAYHKQAAESKAYAQSIRRLLNSGQRGGK